MATPAPLSTATLRQWTQAFVHGTEAGLPLVSLFKQQAKSGPAAGRAVAGRVAERLKKGSSLADALTSDRAAFPVLFLELVQVGEESGRLDESFAALNAHFEQSLAARRVFLSAIAWPAISLVGAILVIALMILVLGLLAPAGGKGFDPLGIGLLGPTGAAVWLMISFGGLASLILVGRSVARSEEAAAQIESFGLQVPGVSGCVQALALSRFATALSMTSHAGMRADRGVAFALRATSNRAYQAFAGTAAKELRAGREITETLTDAPPGLFPVAFLDSLHTGEVTGRLAEVMEREAKNYQAEGARRMKALATAAGMAVYGAVALLIIGMIFRIAMAISGVYSDAMAGL